MGKVEELGWDASTVGEIDHRLLKAPRVKLRSYKNGNNGDVVYCVDLRVTKPNTAFMPIIEMHSLEHFLLEGFQKYLPENFISIGLMGCQTGFYLVLLNEGRAEKICGIYANILEDILTAEKVPYTSIQECGNYRNHDLGPAQNAARSILAEKANWLQVI
jgi:S-ribosylhomocysteine lyase